MVDARVAPKGSLEHLSQQEIAKLLDSEPGRPLPLVSQVRAGGAQFRQRDRRCAGHIRKVPRFRAAHRAPGLGHQARDQECARRRFCRRRDDPRAQRPFVRRAARRGVHIQRDHGKRPLRFEFLIEHHQRRVSHFAERASIGIAGAAESGGLLGRPFDPPLRIRLHEKGRLRAGAAQLGCLHGLRSRRDERPHEGRHHRAFQATHHRRPLLRDHRARDHRGRAAQSRS